MDRRVRKSQMAIETALMGLLQDKDLEKITINAIAEEADVSRGTIYLNYEDKYHIMESYMDKELNRLLMSCIPDEEDHDIQTLLLKAFDYMEKNATIYMTLLGSSGVSIFRNKLLYFVKDSIASQLTITGINKDLNREIFIHFWSTAIIGTIEWWITESMHYSSEEITEYLFHILSRNEVIPSLNE